MMLKGSPVMHNALGLSCLLSSQHLLHLIWLYLRRAPVSIPPPHLLSLEPVDELCLDEKLQKGHCPLFFSAYFCILLLHKEAHFCSFMGCDPSLFLVRLCSFCPPPHSLRAAFDSGDAWV